MSDMSEAEVLDGVPRRGCPAHRPFRPHLGPAQPLLPAVRARPDGARAGRRAWWQPWCRGWHPLRADIVVAPALGGIVLGYELARQLGCTSIFVERVEGSFALRRGFEIPPGSRIVVAEDVDHHRPVDPRMHRLLCRCRRRGRGGRLPGRPQRRQGRTRRAAALPGHARPADLRRAQGAARARGDPGGQAGLARAGCALVPRTGSFA